MLRRALLSVWLVVAVVLLACFPFVAQAQDATPAAALTADDLPPIVAGLNNPRGMTWGTDGTLFVAQAGAGGETPGEPPISLAFMGDRPRAWRALTPAVRATSRRGSPPRWMSTAA